MWMQEKENFYLSPGEGGGAAGSSNDGDEDPDEDPEEDPEGDEEKGEEGKKGTGPKPGSKRWNKIYAGSKLAEQYQELGTPAEVAVKLDRLKQLNEKIAEKEEEGEPDDKETKDLKEKRAVVRKQMREIEPGLERLEELQQHADDIIESLQVRAAEACIEVMEETGIVVDDKSFQFFSKSLNSIILADRKLYLIYLTAPEKAVEKAYAEYAKPFQADGERKKNAELSRQGAALRKLPKTVKSGSSGAQPIKKRKEAADVKEASEQFVEQLEGLAEE